MTPKIHSLFLLAIFAGLSPTAGAWSPKCALGLTPCLESQGTRIPQEEVWSTLDRCREFTARNIGAAVLRMTSVEALKRIGKNYNSPLAQAYAAYPYLYDSPLKFDRRVLDEAQYPGIKRACAELDRDSSRRDLWR